MEIVCDNSCILPLYMYNQYMKLNTTRNQEVNKMEATKLTDKIHKVCDTIEAKSWERCRYKGEGRDIGVAAYAELADLHDKHISDVKDASRGDVIAYEELYDSFERAADLSNRLQKLWDITKEEVI